jgi:uncharacterized membrane protein YhhN
MVPIWEPAISGVFAIADWWAVRARQRVVEYLCKPAVMVVLLLVARSLHPDSRGERGWFLVALACSLAGDVFLMLPDAGGLLFMAGLGAFLLAHVAYIAGFVVLGLSTARLLGGVELAAVGAVVIGGPILRAVDRSDQRSLRGPVIAYMAAISVMLACAVGTGRWFAALGALLFYASDALIAWNRFVRERAGDRVVVIVAYHLAQFALVASLVR